MRIEVNPFLHSRWTAPSDLAEPQLGNNLGVAPCAYTPYVGELHASIFVSFCMPDEPELWGLHYARSNDY